MIAHRCFIWESSEYGATLDISPKSVADSRLVKVRRRVVSFSRVCKFVVLPSHLVLSNFFLQEENFPVPRKFETGEEVLANKQHKLNTNRYRLTSQTNVTD